jgi:minor histocompatibility antigen H13
MAQQIINSIMSQLNATINETMNASNNSTDKLKSTPEGMLCAYGSLIVMALIPIFFGAFRSVKHHKQQKV